MGIYIIECLLNGKWYVGSSKNIKGRWKQHLRRLRKNTHHNIYLQRSFNKYGEDAFRIITLEEVSYPEDLLPREQHYIDLLSPEYNIGSVGGGDNYTNHPRRFEIREALIAHLVKFRESLSEEEHNRIFVRCGKDNPNYRNGLSVKGRVCGCGRKVHKGYKRCITCSNNDRYGEKNGFFGKKHSEETKQHLSDVRAGRPQPHASKSLMSKGVFYEKCSDAAEALGVSLGTITFRINSDKYPSTFFSASFVEDAPSVDDCDVYKYSVEGLNFLTIKEVSEHFGIGSTTCHYRLKSKSEAWKDWVCINN